MDRPQKSVYTLPSFVHDVLIACQRRQSGLCVTA
jgi:hypothetical protein